jgi:hypothetical protein
VSKLLAFAGKLRPRRLRLIGRALRRGREPPVVPRGCGGVNHLPAWVLTSREYLLSCTSISIGIASHRQLSVNPELVLIVLHKHQHRHGKSQAILSQSRASSERKKHITEVVLDDLRVRLRGDQRHVAPLPQEERRLAHDRASVPAAAAVQRNRCSESTPLEFPHDYTEISTTPEHASRRH